MRKDQLEGKKFNRLTAVCSVKGTGRRSIMWQCLCDYGNTSIVAGPALKSGGVKSCGCIVSEMQSLRAKERNTVHGHNKVGEQPPTHKPWVSMLHRCRDEKQKNYGGRGIQVCDRWSIFSNFLNDMGERPEGKTIDRKDPNLGYTKDNCKWATPTEQQRNRRDSIKLMIDGVLLHLIDAAEKMGINSKALDLRVRRLGHAKAIAMGGKKP